jgi:hypothetical protein
MKMMNKNIKMSNHFCGFTTYFCYDIIKKVYCLVRHLGSVGFFFVIANLKR